MRINRLELQGIGPFRDKVEVDFDRLGTSGLYLIDGETGAGKSTLIDAIVYGLYGTLAGTDSDEARMRSKYSTVDSESYVEVDFTTAKGAFRIRRNPPYIRAAKRGGGETPSAAKAHLYKISTDGTLTSVENRITTLKTVMPNEIVGLTKPQFAQTVVLPQGEFANFLKADTKARVDLMEKLFGTELYTKIAELLKNDAAEFQKLLTGILNTLNQDFLVAKTVADLSDEDVATLQTLVNVANFDEVVDELNARIQILEPIRESADKELRAQLKATEDSAAMLALRKTEAAAKQRLDVALAAETAVDTQVEIVLNQVDSVTSELLKFKIEKGSLSDLAVVRTAMTSLTTQQALAESRLEAEREVHSWPSKKAGLELKLSDTQKELDQTRAQADLIPSEIERLEKLVTPKAELTGQLTQTNSEIETLNNGVLLLERFEFESSKLVMFSENLKLASEDALLAQKKLSEAQQSRIRNMAGELAANLAPGEACAVCGSLDHPRPAVPDEALVSAEEVEEFQNSFNKAQEQLTAASAKHSAQEQLVSSLEIQIQDLGDIQSKLATAQEVASKIASQISEIESFEDQLKQLRKDSDSLQTRVTGFQTQLTTVELEIKNGDEHVEQLTTQIAETAKGFESLSAKLEAARQVLGVLKPVVQALEEKAKVAVTLEDARREFELLEQHSDFGDVEAAENAAKFVEELRETAKAEFIRIRNQEEALFALVQTVESAKSEYDSKASANKDLLLLSQIFNRDEESQQNLNIYVLAKLFENVLVGANRYLEGLLNAQFRLEIDQEDGNRNSVRGLGVKVFDAFASDYRSAKTLSGGETFCVSLALALGLADFVRQGAGGIEIGTLFIDEGFGTLSDGPLTDVMNMLTSLQKNGRTVGLISHVDEMKSQISEKIEVHKAAKGTPATVSVTWQGDN